MEEFSRPALALIRDTLSMKGLSKLVIALAADSPDDVVAAEDFFAAMPFPVQVHWTNGPAVRELLGPLAIWDWTSQAPRARAGLCGKDWVWPVKTPR